MEAHIKYIIIFALVMFNARSMCSVHNNDDLRKELEDLKQVSEERFRIVFETLDQLLTIKEGPKKKIGYTAKEKVSKYDNIKN